MIDGDNAGPNLFMAFHGNVDRGDRKDASLLVVLCRICVKGQSEWYKEKTGVHI